MRFRKLRIAWSVVSGIACLLLIVLWVRSYWYRDFQIIDISASRWMHLISMHGRLSCGFANVPSLAQLSEGRDYGLWRRRFTELNGSTEIPPEARPPILQSLLFYWHKYGDGVLIIIPYWFIVIATLMFGALSWIRWPKRFTLRTLLIATILVAVVLGLIVWLER
jgi:hypothetical protein